MQKTLLFLVLIFLVSCVEDEPIRTPKPRMFPRVDFPEKKYKKVTFEDCPFSFEIPTYNEIVLENSTNTSKDDCWFNVDTPQFNARLHCSYSPIYSKKDFNKFVDDAYVLAQKHNQKADFIDTHIYKKSNNVTGVIYSIEGPAASPFQFFLTDSTQHFLRGALYFNTKSRPDSLKPIREFIEVDIVEMMNTFEWE